MSWASSWVVLEWSFGALVVALVLPFLLPRGRRQSGNAARLSLTIAVGLAVAAAGAETTAMDAPGQVLHLGAILALICGLIAIIGLILFDFILPAVGTDVPSIVRDVVQVGIATIAVLICLRLAGLDVLPLLTTSAVLAAIVGLALQAPIANLFGGLALQLDQTLGQGDWIESGRFSGRIVEIGWRSTRVVTREGDTLFLPNSQLLSGEVLNLSRPTGAHRASVRVTVPDQHAPGEVRQLLVDAIRDIPGVLEYPPPDALVADFGNAAVIYDVRYWMTEFERDGMIASEVRSRLWYATRRAGIVLARTADAAVANRVEVVGNEAERRALLLREIDLFAPLDDADRSKLSDVMRRFEFTAGEPIFYQGSSGDALYIVDRGEVGVRMQVDGSSAELARLRRGDIFGEMALLTGEPRTASCIARTEVTCYAIDRDSFEALLAEHSEIAERLATMLARRQSEIESQRDTLSVAAHVRAEPERSRLLGRMRDLLRLS